MALPTLLDIAKMNGSDAVTGLIDETIVAHPELAMGAARTIKGVHYKTLIRKTLPTAAFRNANEGADATKGTYENRLVETFICNPRWECDKAVADRHEDGAAAFIATEAQGEMEASMILLAKQFYYGIANDAKGFPGLVSAYDTTNMEVDAGGTTADTASSVWAVKFGPKNVQWVWGNEGQLALSPLAEARVLDSNNKPFTAYVQEILAYTGLQVGSLKCVGRIKKLTADSGKTLTDARIASLLSKFPVGYMPDVLFMSRRSLEQLRSSRTATNATGAPAPIPTESFGVPIAPTDSILDTESLTL